MINTKLILVDGIPGSGKSTISNYLSRQVEKNGIKVKWLYEQEKDHPLHYDDSGSEDEEYCPYQFMERFTNQWKYFIKKIEENDTVYVIEASIFYNILFYVFLEDANKKDIKKYFLNLCGFMKVLNPVFIHLYQKDVSKHVTQLFEKRDSKQWQNWIVNNSESSIYCKKRDLKGENSTKILWQEFSDFTLELFEVCNLNKVQIETSEQKWQTYRGQMLNHLNIAEINEELFLDSYIEYCGEYAGIKISIKDKRLVGDFYWKNLTLIPYSDDEFGFECFPIRFRFQRENGEISSIIFTKSLCYAQEGDVRPKVVPFTLSHSELKPFCGKYQTETTKNKIDVQISENKLFFPTKNGGETELIPISRNQFIIGSEKSVMLIFKEIGGRKAVVYSPIFSSDIVYYRICQNKLKE